MKTIGLIGGMSWESTAVYYQQLNRLVSQTLGGLHSAKICLCSVDFAEIEHLQHQGKWCEAGDLLSQAAQSLSAAGADFILICTNTMHKVFDQVQGSVSIPLLHIADATGQALQENQVRKIGLLGTQFTMEQAFYKERITQKFGIEVIVPTAEERALVHQVIYQELCLGQLLDSSKRQYLMIMDRLIERGAQGIILGCTEITLLVNSRDTQTPLYDTTQIHVQAAVHKALAEEEITL